MSSRPSVPLWPFFLMLAAGFAFKVAFRSLDPVAPAVQGAAALTPADVEGETALAARPLDVRSVLAGVHGDSYTGGDPRREIATAARLRIQETLAMIDRLPKEAARGLCAATRCRAGSDPALCERLLALSEPQRTFCDELLRDRAGELRGLAERLESGLRISEVPLVASRRPKEPPQPVVALTSAAPEAPVIVHDGTFRAASPAMRIAILVHELGHKISVRGTALTDTKAVGPFPMGEQLLDSLGAAVALFASQSAAVAACGGSASALLDSFLGGLWEDAAGVPVEEKRLVRLRQELAQELVRSSLDEGAQRVALRVLSSREARVHALSTIFQRVSGHAPTDEEKETLLRRLEKGEPIDSVLASLFSAERYARAWGIESDAAYVSAVYRDITGQSMEARMLPAHVGRLRRFGRATWVLGLFRKEPAVMAAVANGWFQKFLRRPAAETERQTWIDLIRAGHDWSELQARLVASAEYRARHECGAGRGPASMEPAAPGSTR